MTILVSSAGRRVELLQCFRRSAEELGLSLRALATDIAPELSAACHCADQAFGVPPCSSPEFVDELLSICRREKVDLIVPTIDTELELLARNKARLERDGVQVAVSNATTVALARNKLRTAEFLSATGVKIPRTQKLEEFLDAPDDWNFPVLLKPMAGSSSIGVHRLDSLKDVRPRFTSYLAQELQSGAEFTVNLFFDGSGLRCAIPHRRLEVRAGEVSKGRTERIPALMQIAQQIGQRLAGKAFGALCFQAILTADNVASVFEINARFGGGYPLAHRAGAEFTRWLLEIAAGRACSAHNNWRENIMMLRSDAAVFAEAD